MQEQRRLSAAVVALAGRRVDAPGAYPPRFPVGNVPLVRRRLAEVLAAEDTRTLVCSAACGADLIALEEAEKLGLRRRIVLPFAPERFRRTSVADRPGGWGPEFDRLVAAARGAGELVVLDGAGEGDAAYAAANEAIVREAVALAEAGGIAHRPVAVVVWEGAPRDGTDATQGFLELAAAAGFEPRSVPTL
ncbi:hypothetical protein ACFQX4_11825 [Roseomonas sp. GCM10028921]